MLPFFRDTLYVLAPQDDFGMQNNLVNKHKQVGLGQPPPVWEKFLLNPVFRCASISRTYPGRSVGRSVIVSNLSQ